MNPFNFTPVDLDRATDDQLSLAEKGTPTKKPARCHALALPGVGSAGLARSVSPDEVRKL